MSEEQTYAVHVSNLAPNTSQATLEHFFSFCGKISSIALEGTSAKVSFVKPSAAKTALMLNGGTLENSQITVSSDEIETPSLAHVTPTTSTAPTHAEKEGHDVEQEDKPRSAVAAEYLAHGYLLSDQAIEKAIAADQQYGISSRFLSFFSPLASKVQQVAQPHVDKAGKSISDFDEKRGISLQASAASIIGAKYYQQALSSPLGARVHAFYTNTAKQVQDVHEEALRIKENKKTSATAPTGSTGTAGANTDTPAAAATGNVDSTKPLETTQAPLVL